MQQLHCPKCKRNQDTIETYRTSTVVTYQCVVCGTYIKVPTNCGKSLTIPKRRQI